MCVFYTRNPMDLIVPQVRDVPWCSPLFKGCHRKRTSDPLKNCHDNHCKTKEYATLTAYSHCWWSKSCFSDWKITIVSGSVNFALSRKIVPVVSQQQYGWKWFVYSLVKIVVPILSWDYIRNIHALYSLFIVESAEIGYLKISQNPIIWWCPK